MELGRSFVEREEFRYYHLRRQTKTTLIKLTSQCRGQPDLETIEPTEKHTDHMEILVRLSTFLRTLRRRLTVYRSYTGSNIVADVAYDCFFGTSPTASQSYEVMIWLAALGGAGPISATGSPIATLTIDGVSWKLFKGMNGSMTVFSFVASSQVTSFSGNLMDFFKYLSTSQGLSTSQYLQSIGAGTEPFTGSNAKLTVSAFSVTVS